MHLSKFFHSLVELETGLQHISREVDLYVAASRCLPQLWRQIRFYGVFILVHSRNKKLGKASFLVDSSIGSFENLLLTNFDLSNPCDSSFCLFEQTFRSLENLLTKNIYNSNLCDSNFCNSKILTILQRARLRQIFNKHLGW